MKLTFRRIEPYLWTLLAAAVLTWAFTGLNVRAVNLLDRLDTAANIFRQMGREFEWTYFREAGLKMLESVQMAVVGTGVAATLAVPFGFWAAQNMARLKAITASGKGALSGVRTFPEMILAILFMRGLGPGPFPGVMAMGVHSVGMLGKLYAEVVEQIDPGPREALVSTGANRVQMIWFAIIPQVLPEFASYVLYRFEINIRAATVLGIVGAGGIGTPMIFAIQQNQWGRVAVILLMIVAVVTLIDYVSGRLRRALV